MFVNTSKQFKSIILIVLTSVMTPSGIDLVDLSVYDGDDHTTAVGVSDGASQGAGSLEIPGFYREVCTFHTP